ncbi:glycosyltransferase family 4 protein [Patescibacteria group bacterium]|nr:glycosyltransferase family 4 protein [Patescibacteria group bacterium]
MGLAKNKIIIIALGAAGEGISGGDRIFIEFTRRWSEKCKVKIYTSQSGKRMCEALNLPPRVIVHDFNFGFIEYLSKILFSIYLGWKLKLENNDIVYSASEFWMDSLPGFILKLRFPKIKWVASWYQTAPNPLVGFAEGKRQERYRWKALLYWLAQLPIKPLISYFSDFILINNENEKRHFKKFEKKLVVVLGAVDTDLIAKYIKKFSKLPKIYEAVFQGRFHPQKGVVELIKIWKQVVDKIPEAKLVMIGDGPLMENVKLQITNYKLQNNVELKGYMFDGDEKFKIFAQSKIVVHPALFDSGGMASAEAMAFGLPCVGFDLPAYVDYYPTGMLKSEVNNISDFSKHILSLLNNKKLHVKMAKSAQRLVFSSMSWDNRADEVLRKLL